MKDSDIQIVEIRAAGPVEKHQGYASCQKWRLPLVYVLADGRQVDANGSYSTKRDAAAFAATLPAPPEHPMAACFNDEGEYWGTSTLFSLGAT